MTKKKCIAPLLCRVKVLVPETVGVCGRFAVGCINHVSQHAYAHTHFNFSSCFCTFKCHSVVHRRSGYILSVDATKCKHGP